MNFLKAILNKVPELPRPTKTCEWAGVHSGKASCIVVIHRECCSTLEGSPYTCEMHLLELADHHGKSRVESHCNNCSKKGFIKIKNVIDLDLETYEAMPKI